MGEQGRCIVLRLGVEVVWVLRAGARDMNSGGGEHIVPRVGVRCPGSKSQGGGHVGSKSGGQQQPSAGVGDDSSTP